MNATLQVQFDELLQDSTYNMTSIVINIAFFIL